MPSSPGIGKSRIVRKLAKKRGWKVKRVKMRKRKPLDMLGVPFLMEHAQEELHKLALDLWNRMAEADKDEILGGE